MTKEQYQIYQILKYGNYLPRRQNVDLDTLREEQRHVCSMIHPDGIYYNLGEQIETEHGIRFEDWCDIYGYDPELSIYAPVYKE